MPRLTEMPDYEPLTRPENSVQTAEADGLLHSRLRPDSTMRQVIATPQGLHEKNSTREQISTPDKAPEPPEKHPRSPLTEHWSIKGGHGITYAGLFLFTVILYFRPYEYLSSAQWLYSSASWMAILTLIIFFPTQFMLEGNLTARPLEVNLVLLLTITGLLSIPFAINSTEAWDTFNDIFIKAVLMFIVIVNVVRTKLRLHGLFLLTLVVSCVISFNAVRDYSAGKVTVEGYRIAGTIGGMFANPNDMALHLVTVIPIAIVLGLSSRNIALKTLYWLVAGLLVAGLTVTYSRGGFLGLIFVVTVLAWKLGRRNRLAVMLALVVGGVAFIAFAPGNYGLRLASIFIPGLDPYGSRGARQDLLTRSVVVALRYPLFGVGMGNFHYRGLQEQVSHNAYTQVAAEMGLAACVIYVKFLLAPLRRLRLIEAATLSEKKDYYYYYLSVGLQASLVGFMVSSFFASVAYHWYLYYLIGYAVCFRRLYESARGVSVDEMLATRKLERKRKRAARGLAPRTDVLDPGPVRHEY